MLGWDGMRWDGMGWDGMGWDGMGWDGMGWDGMGWDGMGWDGMGCIVVFRVSDCERKLGDIPCAEAITNTNAIDSDT